VVNSLYILSWILVALFSLQKLQVGWAIMIICNVYKKLLENKDMEKHFKKEHFDIE